MPIVTKELLDEWITGKVISDDPRVKVSQKKSGPGEYSIWRYMAGVPAFQQREPQRHKNKRKKIILSNAVLKFLAPTSEDLQLVDALTKYYDVYLWPGNNVPLTQSKPIRDSHLFWRERDRIVGASETQVKESLTDQGINNDEFIVLDLGAYNNLTYYLMNSIVPRGLNLLPGVINPHNLTELDEAVNSGDLLQSLSMDPDFLPAFVARYPSKKVEVYQPGIIYIDSTIEVGEVDKSRIIYVKYVKQLDPISFDRSTNDSVYFDSCEFGQLSFPKRKHKRLTFFSTKIAALDVSSSSIPYIQFKDVKPLNVLKLPDNLESLQLLSSTIKAKIQIDQLKSLSELIVRRTNYLDYTKGSVTLKRLVLDSIFLDEIDFSKFPNLEVVELIGLNGRIKNLASLSKLKSLTVSGVSAIETIDLCNHPHLEKLQGPGILIRQPSQVSQANWSTSDLHADVALMPALKDATITSYGNESTFDVASMPLVEKLSLDKYKTHLEVQGRNTHLHALLLKNEAYKIIIDLNHMPDLHELEIQAVAIHFKSGSRSLKKLVLSDREMTSLDLSMFPDLEVLDLTGCTNLKSIQGSFTKLKALTIFNCLQLKYLDLSSADHLNTAILKLESPQESGGPSIENTVTIPPIRWPKKMLSLKLAGYKAKHLDLSDFPTLEHFEINQMQLDRLSSSKQNTIKICTMIKCGVNQLDLHHFDDLQKLYADSVTSIIFPEKLPLKAAQLINCEKLKDFNFAACRELEDFSLRSFAMEGFDFTPCTVLKKVELISDSRHLNNIKINFQSCKQLRSIEIRTERQPIHMDIKGCSNLQNLIIESQAINNQVENPNECRNLRCAVLNCPDCRRIKAKLESNNLPYLECYGGKNTEGETQATLQNYKNKFSKVELFDYDVKEEIDTNTADKAPRIASGSNKLTIYSQQNFIKEHYRISVCDRVSHHNGEIDFEMMAHDLCRVPGLQAHSAQKADEAMIQQCMLEADKDPELIVGLLEVKVSSNTPKAIPTLHSMHKKDIEIYTDPKDAVDILWSEAKKQFYFQPKSPSLKNVTILYKYKYAPQNIDQLNVAEEKNLLTPQLIETLKRKLNIPGSPVAFMFDPQLTKNQKIVKLKKYMTVGFEVVPLSKQSKNSIVKVCDAILEGRGVCRHRARGFMLMAHLIDVPVKMIKNSDHQFCEIPYSGKQGVIWSRADLGGADVVDLTPDRMRVNRFDQVIAKRPSPLKKVASPQQRNALDAAALAAAMAKPKADVALAAYEKMFQQMVAERPINSTWELLEKRDKLPPLMMLSESQDPTTINKQILKQLNARDPYAISKHLYINDPSELDSFLRPRYFANGRYAYEENSQLRHMIKHGGVLVINWTNFTPAQIAGYATLVDKDKILLGESVSKDLFVIGLIKNDNEGCAAFHSRCQPVKLMPDFLKPLTAQKTLKVEKTTETLEVDLFHSISWRELLLGNKVVINSVVQLAEGPLVQAIKQGKKLIIHNPPDDPDFNLLMHHVLDERKVLLNGKLLWVPETLDIAIHHKTHVSQLKNVTITTSPDPNKKHMPLGLHNIHEYYQQLEIKDKKPIPNNGLLARYQSNKEVIYITGFIPEYEWQRLLDEINRNYSATAFEFQLAPGAEIENVAMNHAKNDPKYISKVDSAMQDIISSDPDLTTNALAEELKDPLIVDMTPDMSISDLLYEQTQTETGNDGEVEFNHIEKDALKALRQGRDVILNGELNESLYQQLLPLLDPKATLILNGQEVTLKSKLHLVRPLSAEEQCIQIDVAKIEYRAEDYLYYFNKQDRDLVKRIIDFHHEAMKLPHTGLGMPPNAPLSLQKIKQLLAALKADYTLHRANPIKHVFNYDYPIKSDEYAYLNVLSKYFFAKTTFPVNERKLHELHAEYDFSNKENVRLHAWKILNCLSMAMIHHILSNQKPAISSLPEISDQGMDEIMAFIKPHLAQTHVKERKGQEKQFKQLHQLMQDPDTFLILLKGSPGIGKTHTLKEMFGHCFQGEKDIEKFLREGGNIIFDEGNMATPAFWDFLKGVSRDGKKVYYRGKEYSLVADNKKRTHKIFISGNPENFPGRYHHALFQEYGKTVYFQKPPHHYLENVIMKKILASSKQDKSEVMQAILKIYDSIEKINPNLYCSIRDLENVCLRYIALLRMHPTTDSKLLLMKACRYEFLDIFKDPEHKEQFAKLIEETLKVAREAPTKPELIYITPSHPMPNSQLNLIEAIDCQLTMRREMQRNGASTVGSMKRCIILEGESGIGKSRLFIKMLKRRVQDECKGKTKEEAEKIAKAWDYVQINAATKNVRQVMIDAFYAGKTVILNEINLDNTHEKLLNQLLDGNDEEIKDNEKPLYAREVSLAKLSVVEREAQVAEMKRVQRTMMILASQNPGSYAGRVATSQALRNRSDFHYVDLSKADMVLLSNLLYVEAYDKVKRVNRRHFFEGIRAERKASKRPRI